MNLDSIISDITTYMQSNLIGSIAAGVILLFVAVKRPKLFLVILFICLAAIGFMQVFDKVSSTGITEKDFSTLKDLK